jgi:hypothetical protein
MPPKLTGKALLERWRTFISEHKAAPVECGGAGHALAVITRQKLTAGHLSRSEIAELNRLKGDASRASSTNSGDAHPAVASGVGAAPGAAGRCDSGVQQLAAGEHAVAQSAKASASGIDSSGVKQTAAHSKNEDDAQPQKRLCLGAQGAVASSGSAHPAAPSGTLDVVESFSSGGPHPAASWHGPRSPMVFLKILEPIWANEVADGQKMFECVANRRRWQNQFKQLCSGDLFIVVMKGRDKVAAVCEVASPAILKETNGDVLKSKLQESRHEALDAYLGGAESFDYVEFKHVLDCRFFLPVSGTAAFLERVGLALPKSPLVGLLRPVVIDAQWHSRLQEYMQQAVLRGPVDTLDSSSQGQALLKLEVETRHHDAIASGRQRWEARPMLRGNNRGRGPSHDDKLATVGRQVILQSWPAGRTRKADTSLWRVAEVRRYASARDMVSELAAGCHRLEAYTDLYGQNACARGFVAMRLGQPKEAPEPAQRSPQTSLRGDAHPAACNLVAKTGPQSAMS